MQAATSTATHAALFEPRWPYDGEAIEFPTSTPPFLGAALSDEPFDAAKHLAYVPPATVYDYRFRPHRVGALAPDFCGLGMTEPFQLLSDEGVKVARRLVDQHKFDKRFKSDLPGRQPFRLRGLGYVSQFIRGLNRSPEVDAIVSSFVGEPAVAHSMPSNYSHINIGEPNSGLPVDRWHIDSVDFVLICLLSDPEGMEGGELQVVAEHEPEQALKLLEKHNGNPPKEFVRSLRIPKAGWAVLMQGSKIAHHVTEVLRGNERISMVNSYMLRDVWKSEDRTRMGTFVGDRGNPISDMGLIEFSRHRAWRVKQLMDYIINSAKYGEQPESTAEILRVMDAAQRELAQAKAIISGETADKFVYKFDEVSEKKKGAVPEQPRM